MTATQGLEICRWPSGCPTCCSDDDDLVRDTPYALFCCVAHAAPHATFLDSLRELVRASSCVALMHLAPTCRSIALLRDDFMSYVADPTVVHYCKVTFLNDINSHTV